MPRLNPTVDELVSILRRSRLPTIVVEGKEDMQIFRWMEDLLERIERKIAVHSLTP